MNEAASTPRQSVHSLHLNSESLGGIQWEPLSDSNAYLLDKTLPSRGRKVDSQDVSLMTTS